MTPARREGLHLRGAGAEDLPAILELSARLYQEDGAKPLDRDASAKALERLLREPERGEAWVVEGNEGLAGYFILTFGFSLEYQGVDALLDEIYVEHRRRRSGIGRWMLERAAEICRERGVRALHLEVEKTNGPAQAFYAGAGFGDSSRLFLTKWL